MNAGDIYNLEFPFQEGQGGKFRPVLIFVLTSTPNEFIGLKTKSNGSLILIDSCKLKTLLSMKRFLGKLNIIHLQRERYFLELRKNQK